MIGKIKKGRSFGGCIRYVTQKDDAKIIASEGVLLGTAEEMAHLMPETAREPAMALEAGEDGLVFYRAIAEHYQKALRPGGALALEIGWQQREAVTALLAANGWTEIVCRKDFGGNDRCVMARKQ